MQARQLLSGMLRTLLRYCTRRPRACGPRPDPVARYRAQASRPMAVERQLHRVIRGNLLILPKVIASNPPIESMACGAFSGNYL